MVKQMHVRGVAAIWSNLQCHYSTQLLSKRELKSSIISKLVSIVIGMLSKIKGIKYSVLNRSSDGLSTMLLFNFSSGDFQAQASLLVRTENYKVDYSGRMMPVLNKSSWGSAIASDRCGNIYIYQTANKKPNVQVESKGIEGSSHFQLQS